MLMIVARGFFQGSSKANYTREVSSYFTASSHSRFCAGSSDHISRVFL